MAENRGKDFESRVQEQLEMVSGCSVDRLHDQTTRYKGSGNPCDFIVYKCPCIYYIECKTTHNNTLSIYSDKGAGYGAFTEAQWNGLKSKAIIPGAIPGALIWFIEKDITVFVHADDLLSAREEGRKSIRFDDFFCYPVIGKKLRVFFKYDFAELLKRLGDIYGV